MLFDKRRRAVLLCLACISALFLVLQLYSRDELLPGLRYHPPVQVFTSWPHVEVVVPPNNETWPYRIFKSSPLRPPNISIAVNEPGTSKDYLFITSTSRNGRAGEEQEGPFILTSENELVYAYQSFTPQSFNNFRVQSVGQKQHLTFWRGSSFLGHGYGEVVMLDDEYTETIIDLDVGVRPPPGIQPGAGTMDFHEQELTATRTVFFTAYNETTADLSSVGGAVEGNVVDSMFFEVDLATKKIIFSWSALAHLPVSASLLPLASDLGLGDSTISYDPFHINSIQTIGADYLISSRHNWAIYLVSGRDGHIIWTLSGDGRDSDFGSLSPAAQFQWQHDVRAHDISDRGMRLSLFDNHCRATEECLTHSRGIQLYLQLPPDPIVPLQLLGTVSSDAGLFAKSQGSYQARLDNGNQLLSFGPAPVIQEFASPQRGNKLLWEGRFGHDDKAQTYRAYKSSWKATPRDWKPSLFIFNTEARNESGSNAIRAHVSWNGATNVDEWRVYRSDDPGRKAKLVGIAVKRGFETVFDLFIPPSSCISVAAIQAGLEVRRSNIACL